jgi:hypothetical protein
MRVSDDVHRHVFLRYMRMSDADTNRPRIASIRLAPTESRPGTVFIFSALFLCV